MSKSFAETALEVAGKTQEEAQRTGKIDQADDNVEEFFKLKTSDGPAHRAIWAKEKMSAFKGEEVSIENKSNLQCCLDLLNIRKNSNTLYDETGKIHQSVLDDLSSFGYWGTLISKEFSGEGLSFAEFTKFLTSIACIDPTIAGLASVHGCIGAVDPIRTFGTNDQKEKYLPLLATGKKLSGFALTEPNAGSDLTALKTTAKLEGDYYIVNGEKLFITNATYGRIVGLVCLVENKPAVLIVELPDSETETFQIVKYDIHALTHTHNVGLKFINFKVPKENLLEPKSGDGLTIAYHGLNLGRVSLCANAAGVMRKMLSDLIPWVKKRVTYGQPISERELVQRRLAKLAGYIIGADALANWCSTLLDKGHRGEIECIIAKIFGSERQKEAAIELYMKTYGGRSFLKGNMLGDNIHDFLAPCIYEGEGEVLSLALFKSLIKEHGKEFFAPIAQVLSKLKIKVPKFHSPKHMWNLKEAFAKYGVWLGKKLILSSKLEQDIAIEDSFKPYLNFALKHLSKEGLKISKQMVKYQLSLADRQTRILEMSNRVQKLITMLVTITYCQDKSEVEKLSGLVLCGQLKSEICGNELSDREIKLQRTLSKKLTDMENSFGPLNGLVPDQILMPY